MRRSTCHCIRTLLPVCLLLLGLSAIPVAILPVKAATVGTLYVSPPTQDLQPAGATVTYQVKVANMATFSGWDISVKTNPAAINPDSLSISGNLLAANFSLGPIAELINCVNQGLGIGQGQPGNIGCDDRDGPGIAHSAIQFFGPPPTSSTPINGLLFAITYKAAGGTSSSVSIINDVIADGSPKPVEHTTVNGFYGQGKLIIVDFSWSPLTPIQGEPVLFDASNSSDPNVGAQITSYSWDFGDRNFTSTPNPTITHTYKFLAGSGNVSSTQRTVTLTVTDSLGIQNSKTKVIAGILRPFHDVRLSGINVSPSDSILAGTTLTIDVLVQNNGTFPETGFDLTVSMGVRTIGTRQFTDGNLTRGQTWIPRLALDTTGFKPGSYEIDALVSPIRNSTGQVIERSTANNMLFHVFRILEPVQASLIPFTMNETIGLVIGVLVGTVALRSLQLKARAKRKRLAEELA